MSISDQNQVITVKLVITSKRSVRRRYLVLRRKEEVIIQRIKQVAEKIRSEKEALEVTRKSLSSNRRRRFNI